MKKFTMSVAVLATIAAGAAQARDVGISADIGTTGAGFHLVTSLHDRLNARLGINGLSYSTTKSTDDADFDASLKMRTVDALLDYYPTTSQFRLSAGLIYNGSKITARAKPTSQGEYTFNDTTYKASDAGQVDGRIDFRKTAPYLGIGWGNAVAVNKGWGVTSDIGVMFQGSPRTQLTNTGCNPALVDCVQLQSDLEAERRKLDDKARDIRYYPVIRIGATYKF